MSVGRQTRRAVLIAAIILGGLFAFNWPCTWSAMQRSRQKTTMADLQRLGSAIEAYRSDHDGPPSASTVDELGRLLVPKYADAVPRVDGWKTELRYQITSGSPAGYTISSAGKDRTWEKEVAVPPFMELTRYFDCDIVYSNGGFVQSPEGIPRSRP